MDKQNLSKIKYIYELYKDSDKILHVKRHPVIYINRSTVYFRRDDNEYLTDRQIDNVCDTVEEASIEIAKYRIVSRYFWKPVDCDDNQYFKSLAKDGRKRYLEQEINRLSHAANEWKKRYESIINKVEKMKLELDGLESEE